MGERPQGMIVQTLDDRMSAQLMRPGVLAFASGDWCREAASEITAEAAGYIACSGPFHAERAKQQLIRTKVVSPLPSWLGQTQPRVVRVEGETLQISTNQPIRSDGKKTMSSSTWKRADRANGRVPMPGTSPGLAGPSVSRPIVSA